MGWQYQTGVQTVWEEMEINGFGPDQHSYTIMVHGLYNQGKLDGALEMCSMDTSSKETYSYPILGHSDTSQILEWYMLDTPQRILIFEMYLKHIGDVSLTKPQLQN